jgi:hypothetical protein
VLLYEPSATAKRRPRNESAAAGIDDDFRTLLEFGVRYEGRPVCGCPCTIRLFRAKEVSPAEQPNRSPYAAYRRRRSRNSAVAIYAEDGHE